MVVVDVDVGGIFLEVTWTTAGIVGGEGICMVVPPRKRKTHKITCCSEIQVKGPFECYGTRFSLEI